MKKLITLAFLAATSTNLFAQTENSYLLLNVGLQKQPNFIGAGVTHAPIGIQWIKGAKNHSAYRIGLQYSNIAFAKYSSSSFNTDTSYSQYSSYQTSMPKLMIGKEWRKQLHKDISIYGGSDFGIGFSKSQSYTSNTMHYTDTLGNQNHIGYYSYSNHNKIVMSVSARPFIGIRTDWNRFVVGYEASLPINYSQVFGANAKHINGFKPNHQISIGYKLGKNKK